MKKNALSLLSAILSLALASSIGSGPAAAESLLPVRPPLELYEQVPVPGYLGRIDHFSGNGRMVYFSIAGSNGIGIENWFEGRSVGFIPGVPEPQGVLYVPGYDKIFAASAQGKVYIFSGKTHKLEKAIDFGADADNLRWDPVHKVVLVGFGEDHGGIASIDPATDARVGTVLKTGGHPEGFQIELHGPMIYLNCPDAGQVVEEIGRAHV